MKKIMLSVLAFVALSSAAIAQTAPAAKPAADVNPNAADYKFEKEVHDFGNVKEGVQAEYTFKFTNTGKEPLVITNVQASCGCTTPKWTKEPVKPGDVGTVTAIYNSKGRPGTFNKAITITSNAKTAQKVLFIKGNVEAESTQSESAMPVKKDVATPSTTKPQ
jgi:hypothetical protein